jgi:hypothetical protein
VEEQTLMLGVILMLVAGIGILMYAALVIAIPVCRMLDWFTHKDEGIVELRVARRRTSLLSRLSHATRRVLRLRGQAGREMPD